MTDQASMSQVVSRGVTVKREVDISAQFAPLLPNANPNSKFKFHIEKSSATESAAVCILTEPTEMHSTQSLASLDKWWIFYKHILALHTDIPSGRGRSSIFLVTSTFTTPQFAICLTKCEAKATTLEFSGGTPVISEDGQFAVNAGCTIKELGMTFGFHIGLTNLTNPWVVFAMNLYCNVWGPFSALKSQLWKLFQYVRGTLFGNSHVQ
jgi:hypothetical protein